MVVDDGNLTEYKIFEENEYKIKVFSSKFFI